MTVEITDAEAAALMGVTDAVVANEEDSDTIDMLNDGIQKLIDLFNIGRQQIEQGHSTIDADAVKSSFDILSTLSPSHEELRQHRVNNGGDPHPGKRIHVLLNALDRQSRLDDFDIPSFREWEVIYIDVTGKHTVPNEFTDMEFDEIREHDDVLLMTTPGEYGELKPVKTINGTEYCEQEQRKYGEYDEHIVCFVSEV